MSDITLCLITKGRPDFLNELLASFDRALDHKNVKVLVILNGVDPKIMNDFYKWGGNISDEWILHHLLRMMPVSLVYGVRLLL